MQRMPKVRSHRTALHSLHETARRLPRARSMHRAHTLTRAHLLWVVPLRHLSARPPGGLWLFSICMYEYFTGEEEPTSQLKTKLAEMEAKNDAAMTEVR